MTAQDVEAAILQETRTEVGYADQKASMVLAALGIGFGALIGGFLAGDWRPSELHGWALVWWWAGAVAAMASVVSAASAVWPRYKRPKTVTQVHYWGEVARFKSVAALTAHLQTHPLDATDRTRFQMWELSRIVAIKYRRIRSAFVLSALAAACFLLSVALN